METPSKPSGGQSETLPAETSATRSGVIRMSVHIPDNWNPHADLLAIADLARDLVHRGDKLRDKAAKILADLDAEDCPNEDDAQEALAEAEDLRARARIEPEAVREINFRACLLAMRLSACQISLPREDSPAEMIAEIAAYTGPHYGRMSEAYAARQALSDHPAEAEESLRATVAAVRAEAKAEAASAAAKAAAANLESARSAASK